MFNNLKAKLQEATAASRQTPAATKSSGNPKPNRDDFLADDDDDDDEDLVVASKPAAAASSVLNANSTRPSASTLDPPKRPIDGGSELDLSDISSSNNKAKQRAAQQQQKPLPSSSSSNIVGGADRLSQKFAQLESIVREVTPLDGLEDLDAFAGHLKGLMYQKTASVEEIKRLSLASEEQRKHIQQLQSELSKIREIQALESSTKGEMFNSMQKQLEAKEEEIFRLRKTKTDQDSAGSSSNGGETPLEETNRKLELKVKELGDTVKQYGDRLTKIMDKAKTLYEENQKLKTQLEPSASPSPSAAPVTAPSTPPTSTSFAGDSSDIEKWRTRARDAAKEVKEGLARENELRNYISQLELRISSPTASESMQDSKDKSEEQRRQQIAEYEQQIRQLNDRLGAESTAKSKYLSDFEDSKVHIKELSESIDLLKRQLQEGQRAVENAIDSDNASKREMDELQLLISRLRKDAEQSQQAHKQTLNERIEHENQLSRKISNLEKEFEVANQTHQAQMASFESEKQKLSGQLDERRNLEEQIRNSELRSRDLETQLANLQEQLHDRENQIFALKRSASENDSNFSKAQHELELLKATHETTQGRLDQSLRELEAQQSASQQMRKDFDEKITNLEAVKSKSEAIADDLISKIKTLEEALRGAESEKSAVESTKQSLERQLDSVKEMQSHTTDEAQSKISSLISDIESVRIDLDTARRELGDSARSILEKDALIESLSAEKANTAADITALRSELKAAKDYSENLLQQVSTLSDEAKLYKNQLVGITKERDSHAEKLASHEHRMEALEIDKMTAESSLKELNGRLIAGEQRITELNQQITSLETSLAAASKERENQQTRDAENQQLIDELRGRMSGMEKSRAGIEQINAKEKEEIQAQLDASIAELQQLKKLATDTDKEHRSQLAEASAKHHDQINTLQQRLEQLEMVNSELQSQVEIQQAARANLQTELEESNDQNSKLDLQLASAKEEIGSIKAQFEKSSVEKDEELNQLLTKLRDFQSSLEAKNAEQNGLADQLLSLQAECDSLRKQSGNSSVLQDELDRLREELQTSKASYEQSLNEERAKLQKSVDLLRQGKAQVTRLEQELLETRKEINTSQIEAEKLKERMSAANSQISASATENADLKSKMIELQQEIVRLRNDHDKLSEEALKAHQLSESMTDQIDHLRQEKFAAEDTLTQKIRILEEELLTSRGLFEQRTEEHEKIKIEKSDVERLLEQISNRLNAKEQELIDIIDSRQDDMGELRRQLDDQIEQLKSKDSEIASKAKVIEVLQKSLHDSAALATEKQLLEQELSAARADSNEIASLKSQLDGLKDKYDDSCRELQKFQKEKLQAKEELQRLVEDYSSREKSLNTMNQTLKDEIRKYQAAQQKKEAVESDDSINMQYIRNVVLRFMTDSHMRPQLVPVLGSIFNFTAEERAKIAATVPSLPLNK